jgi:ketosteroid isomerase-like protein
MPAANVAVAAQLIEAINARDVDALRALASDDIEVVPLRAALEGTSYHGKDGLAQFVHDVSETWVDFHIDLEDSREVRPGSVLGRGTMHGRGQSSAVPTNMPVGLVARVRDGLVTYAAVFTDRDEAARTARASS